MKAHHKYLLATRGFGGWLARLGIRAVGTFAYSMLFYLILALIVIAGGSVLAANGGKAEVPEAVVPEPEESGQEELTTCPPNLLFCQWRTQEGQEPVCGGFVEAHPHEHEEGTDDEGGHYQTICPDVCCGPKSQGN